MDVVYVKFDALSNFLKRSGDFVVAWGRKCQNLVKLKKTDFFLVLISQKLDSSFWLSKLCVLKEQSLGFKSQKMVAETRNIEIWVTYFLTKTLKADRSQTAKPTGLKIMKQSWFLKHVEIEKLRKIIIRKIFIRKILSGD